MGALLVVVDVLDLAKHAEVLVDVIARRQVELEARIDEGRFGTELSGILVLAELEQILVAPVERRPELEAVLVVEAV